MTTPERWKCWCGEETPVRHWLQRDGAMVHDPEAAYREATGLDESEPDASVNVKEASDDDA